MIGIRKIGVNPHIFGSGGGGIDLTKPTFISSYVGPGSIVYPPETYDNILVVVMSENLNATIIPATTAFVVNDGAANVVTNIAINRNRITLTLTNNIDYGDSVTIAYTKPGSNPLQDRSSNEADSWTAETTLNRVFNYMRDQDDNLILDNNGHPIVMR